jgi:hypothetical protein
MRLRPIRYISTVARSLGGITRVKQAVEMPAYGKLGKRYYCFPPFSQALEIKIDFHIATTATNTSTEQVFHFKNRENCLNYRDRITAQRRKLGQATQTRLQRQAQGYERNALLVQPLRQAAR